MSQSQPHFDVSKPMLEQVSQAMLECKKMGRSAENTVDSLLPLTDHQKIRDDLNAIAEAGRVIAVKANGIYQLIAREAAKP